MADLKPKIKRHLLYTEDICKFSAFKEKTLESNYGDDESKELSYFGETF